MRHLDFGDFGRSLQKKCHFLPPMADKSFDANAVETFYFLNSLLLLKNVRIPSVEAIPKGRCSLEKCVIEGSSLVVDCDDCILVTLGVELVLKGLGAKVFTIGFGRRLRLLCLRCASSRLRSCVGSWLFFLVVELARENSATMRIS